MKGVARLMQERANVIVNTDCVHEDQRLLSEIERLAVSAGRLALAVLQVKQVCFEGALARREPWGVWGGELFVNGKVIAQKRRRGRPPKQREAETIVIDGVEVIVVPAIQSA